jgi:hypothetical protein
VLPAKSAEKPSKPACAGGRVRTGRAALVQVCAHAGATLRVAFAFARLGSLSERFSAPRSSVAQWQSIRLLTGGLLVRVQPEEPAHKSNKVSDLQG